MKTQLINIMHLFGDTITFEKTNADHGKDLCVLIIAIVFFIVVMRIIHNRDKNQNNE